MKHLADDALLYGSYHYDQWLDAYEGIRVASARLMDADRVRDCDCEEHLRRHRDGRDGARLEAGRQDRSFREEFPANYFPWHRLESKGCQGRMALVSMIPWTASTRPPKGARLLAISFVQYLGGYRADLAAIGEICRRRGALFFVDAIQGLGAFPLDVRKPAEIRRARGRRP